MDNLFRGGGDIRFVINFGFIVLSHFEFGVRLDLKAFFSTIRSFDCVYVYL